MVRRSRGGFTLIEVMIALAVAAIGLMAVAAAQTRSLDIQDALETRTYAAWVASNRMAEIRMERFFSTGGSASSSLTMAGQQWTIVETFFSTPDPDIARITVEVFRDEESVPVVVETGYLGRDPEQS